MPSPTCPHRAATTVAAALLVLFCAWGLVTSRAAAQGRETQGRETQGRETEGAQTQGAQAQGAQTPDEGFGAEGVVDAVNDDATRESLGRSVVSARELEERLPRSAPDALRYEPGVSVQQTAHAQASPYVRGMTGQQVVHLFDGVRLNNSIYRQGPNQYFFSVDTYTLAELEVLRGSASTRYGSDALGGAILATPRRARFGREVGTRGVEVRPRFFARFGSADGEWGGRAELAWTLGRDTSVLMGAGYRDVGLLESGGQLPSIADDVRFVPRFAEDGRTMLGTGFKETTFDFRLVHDFGAFELVAASYAYLQEDAPRTDQCPPPEAPSSECLTIDPQLRTLTYVSLRGSAGRAMDRFELTASWQHHDEHRVRERPRSYVRYDWDNQVDTLGLAFRASTAAFALSQSAEARVRYGAEGYTDLIGSSASLTFTDLERTFDSTRGQYLAGSRYHTLAAFTELELALWDRLTLRGGGRLGANGARAPADPETDTLPVNKDWVSVVGRVGAELQALRELRVVLNLDQGFRAPNLDDLTARQSVGPGYQYENPTLKPERSLTTELGVLLDWEGRGARAEYALALDVWGFATLLEDGIFRAVREAEDCPQNAGGCTSSRNQFQLVNAEGEAWMLGAEGGVTAYFPQGFSVRATLAYAWGEGPNTGSRTTAGESFYGTRVPISRVPPLNGTVETRWRHRPSGIYLGGALRWADAQTRLAPSDLSDARIPRDGTPGYAVLDLRAGWRAGNHFRVSGVFENVFDAAYRVHGSSINGAGRSFSVTISGGLD